MTTENEISEQIQSDYNRFWFSQYDAELPTGFINKFREALMFQNAISLKGNPTVLKEIIGMKEEDLKFVHVGIICNTIFSTPFNAIFFSPEEALDAVIEYKEIEKEFNKLVEIKTKDIERKRARLLGLSGITKSISLNGNPKN